MRFRTITIAVLVVTMVAATSGLAAANHDGADQCDQLDNALDAIDEHADENGEDNNEVDRAKDECEGDHHQDQANDGSDNADAGGSASEQRVGLAFGLVA